MKVCILCRGDKLKIYGNRAEKVKGAAVVYGLERLPSKHEVKGLSPKKPLVMLGRASSHNCSD